MHIQIEMPSVGEDERKKKKKKLQIRTKHVENSFFRMCTSEYGRMAARIGRHLLLAIHINII